MKTLDSNHIVFTPKLIAWKINNKNFSIQDFDKSFARHLLLTATGRTVPQCQKNGQNCNESIFIKKSKLFLRI